jgi:hypothetical protein
MELEFSSTDFQKIRSIKFSENPSIDNPELSHADGHNEADGRFSQFCECA